MSCGLSIASCAAACGCLGSPDVVKCDVGLTLEPSRVVPFGTPVSPQHDSAPLHPRRELDAQRVTSAISAERNRGAVGPEPLEGVVGALLLVLHVHDDVEVVEQHPAVLPLALAVRRLLTIGSEPLLDRLDDGAHLTVVGRRAKQEGVGHSKLVADVERDDVHRKLVGGRSCGFVHQANGLRDCGHTAPRATLTWMPLASHGSKSAPKITMTSAMELPWSLTWTAESGTPRVVATSSPSGTGCLGGIRDQDQRLFATERIGVAPVEEVVALVSQQVSGVLLEPWRPDAVLHLDGDLLAAGVGGQRVGQQAGTEPLQPRRVRR